MALIHHHRQTEGDQGVATDSPHPTGFRHALALRVALGQAWVDWLFMLGLLGIGLALLFGIGMRAGTTWGLGRRWAETGVVRRHPVLR